MDRWEDWTFSTFTISTSNRPCPTHWNAPTMLTELVSFGRYEPVPFAVNGLEIHRRGRILLDFLANRGNIAVDGSRGDSLRRSPYVLDQRFAIHRAASIPEEVPEEIKLFGGERNALAIAIARARTEIKREIPNRAPPGRGGIGQCVLPEERLDPEFDLSNAKGTDDEVIGAQVEVSEPIVEVCRIYHHKNACIRSARPHLVDQMNVFRWISHIQKEEIKSRRLIDEGRCRLASGGRRNRESLLQKVLHKLHTSLATVRHDEQAPHGRSSILR